MRIAVLDDYQNYSARWGGWSRIADLEVAAFRDHAATEDDLVARLSGFDVVMRIRERAAFPRNVLTRLPNLKLILATGIRNADSIDLAAAQELGVTVCATQARHGTTVDLTWALILALARRLPQETAALRAGGWQIGLGRSVSGMTLGVVGVGNIGLPVARIGLAFGMRVLGWSPRMTPDRAHGLGVEFASKEALFAESDIVTIHLPAAPGTLGLVDAAAIARMRADAYLINTSRAAIVDQDALLAALAANRIAGAGLDVFDIEPLPPAHPFRTLPNVLATPHIGFVTDENYELFFQQSLENLKAFRAGRPIRVISADRPAIAGFNDV